LLKAKFFKRIAFPFKRKHSAMLGAPAPQVERTIRNSRWQALPQEAYRIV